MFSEDELVDAIRRVLAGETPGVRLGVGDDAAVVEAGSGDLVLTSDMLVEGADFRLGRTSPRDLGYKSIVVNVSDIAAMAASPRYALVSLGLPPDVDLPWVVELYGGMRTACEEYALTIVGGDLSSAGQVVVSVSVAGSAAPGKVVARSGARPGDRVVVTGVLGAAAGGLVLAELAPQEAAKAASSGWGRALLEAAARPVARVGEAQTLAAHGATSMIDVSDGFARDCIRVCEASGVGARIRTADVPVAPELASLAEVADVEPLGLALGGGEDFELIATLPLAAVDAARSELEHRFFVALTDVGEITDGVEVFEVPAGGGAEVPLEAQGWDHFAR
ncbi:MAG: thiamine-phosphate kinase [Actinomycetota bacterium]